MSFIVAIDGPAGSGKGTVTKLVADKLGLVTVDTGAMYRAMALYFLVLRLFRSKLQKQFSFTARKL